MQESCGRDGDGTLAFQRSLPTKRMAAGLLVRDAGDRVLLVEPTYKRDWEIPGGAIERGESPRECVVREATEELGIHLFPGPLVVVDYQHPSADRTESVMFVFDGGVADDDLPGRVSLPEAELRSCAFVASSELATFTSPRLALRLHAALEVVRHAGAHGVDPAAVYLENGQGPSR